MNPKLKLVIAGMLIFHRHIIRISYKESTIDINMFKLAESKMFTATNDVITVTVEVETVSTVSFIN
jgi:hypothetical protein